MLWFSIYIKMAANQVYLHMHILFCFFCLFFIDIVYFCCFRYFCTNGCVLFSLTLHPTKMESNGSQSFLFGFFLSSFEIFSIFFAIYSVWWWFDMDLLFHFWGGLFRPLHTYMRSVIFHLKCHISSVYGWNVKS